MKKFVLIISILSYFIGMFVGSRNIINLIGNTKELSENYETIENKYSLHFEIALKILKNNLQVVITNVLLGSLSFGILSYIYTFYNGLVHGYIFASFAKIITLKKVVLLTLPHSIELIGIIWSCYIGAYMSYSLYLHFFKNNELPLKNIFYQLMACCSIIIVAAFIESYISMSLNF